MDKPTFKVEKTPENRYRIVYTGTDGNEHYWLVIDKYCFVWETGWKWLANRRAKRLNRLGK